MGCARLDCACAFVEVAGILVQKRRKSRAAEHDVRETIGIVCGKPFTVADGSLRVIWVVGCLPDSGDHRYSGKGKWVYGNSERETQFQSRAQSCRIGSVYGVEIGNNEEAALPLLRLDLFGRDLVRALGRHRNGGFHFLNP